LVALWSGFAGPNDLFCRPGLLHLLCSFVSFFCRISRLCRVNHCSPLVDEWTLEELIAGVGDIDRSAAFKALVTWVNMGVLKEDPENTFVLLERAEEDVSGKRSPEEWGVSAGTFWLPIDSSLLALIGGGVNAGPELPPVITAQQQQAEQMKVYWKVRPFIPSQPYPAPKLTIRQFIEGMLTNLGGLPLDRIQTMLKFAPGYDQSIEQLATFMEAARREGLVVVRDGMWRLNK
jgi:anaphase-promoting complex subunit 2